MTQNAKKGVAGLAGRQYGRIARVQLKQFGIGNQTIDRWVNAGYLHRVLPHVYAVGHLAKTIEADLAAAVLYAGPGAMLSHATAAWWVGLADSRPHMLDVSTPRRCLSIPGIRVHDRRPLKRKNHKGLPVTEFTQTMLDYAARASLSNVRRALAKADYQGGLNAVALENSLGKGHRGARRLRAALENHQPALADARSHLEIMAFELCEAENLSLPELNGDVGPWTVDLLWRHERLAVEFDGPRNHRSAGQVRRDRRKEFDLRATGFTVRRYSDDQVEHQGPGILAEIRQNLGPATTGKRPAHPPPA